MLFRSLFHLRKPKAPGVAPTGIVAPSFWKLAAELRWLQELIGHLATSGLRQVKSEAAGDGRPVLVIPGFLCSDVSTWPLRRYLRGAGYRSYRWKQGVNWGQRPGVRTRLLHRIGEIHRATGKPVTLIGWSLGGVYARELACIRPDLIREVITLGSPWHGNPRVTSVWGAYEWLNRKHIANGAHPVVDGPEPTVPCTSIYSRGDGIVPWEMSRPRRGLRGKSLEVEGSHIGLVFNNQVMGLVRAHLGADPPPV